MLRRSSHFGVRGTFACEKECFRVELNRNSLRTALHGYAVHCDDADDSRDDGLEDAS